MNRRVIVCLALVATGHVLMAQEPSTSPVAKPEVPAISLTVKPAAAPVPALKYQLLPDALDLEAGNAIVNYYRAFSPEWALARVRPGLDIKLDNWKGMPLADLPRQELRFLQGSDSLKEIDRAARRDQCDWQIRDRIAQ